MKRHRWSGWPGAWCLDCGLSDGAEIALANNDLDPGDPETGSGPSWKDEETRLRYLAEFPPE